MSDTIDEMTIEDRRTWWEDACEGAIEGLQEVSDQIPAERRKFIRANPWGFARAVADKYRLAMNAPGAPVQFQIDACMDALVLSHLISRLSSKAEVPSELDWGRVCDARDNGDEKALTEALDDLALAHVITVYDVISRDKID